jgi:hypothetical protein
VSRWTLCERSDFIRKLRRLGFDGPFTGTRHQFMVLSQKRLAVPSNSEYSVPQLRMMIREVEAMMRREVTWDEWNNLEGVSHHAGWCRATPNHRLVRRVRSAQPADGL